MTTKELKFQDPGELYPSQGVSTRLLVGCPRADYSASRLATAVEDCNAHVLNLNVTDLGSPEVGGGGFEGPETVIVDLRVSHRSPMAVSRSLERYGYTVLMASGEDFDSEDPGSDSLRMRINELLRYIDT